MWGPHHFFGVRLHLGDAFAHGLETVFVQDGLESDLAHMERIDRGLDVADALVGHPDVGEDQVQEVLVHLPFPKQADGRKPEPFLEDLRRLAHEPPRSGASDVRPVTGVRQPGKDLPFVIEGLQEGDVHQVGSARVRVVHHEDVARLEIVHDFERRLDRELHGPDEDGKRVVPLGDDLPRCAVVDTVGAVVAFGDDGRKGRLDHGGVHLVGGEFQARLHDGQSDWINGHDSGFLSMPQPSFRRARDALCQTPSPPARPHSSFIPSSKTTFVSPSCTLRTRGNINSSPDVPRTKTSVRMQPSQNFGTHSHPKASIRPTKQSSRACPLEKFFVLLFLFY